VGFYIAAMLSSTATTTIDRDETEELGKALGLDFALTFLFLPRPFASANKPAEEDPPEKVLLDAKKTGSDLIKKEFDDEGKLSDGMSGMRLSYFGRRYYDPEIGYWIAVDPKGQFFNGYAYAGGGTNPIIFVDPNGEWIGFAIGATIGGIAGLAYGYNKTGDWGQAFPYSLAGSVILGVAGHVAEKLIVAGMEHAHPTGNTVADNTHVRSTLKDWQQATVNDPQNLERGGFFKEANGKYTEIGPNVGKITPTGQSTQMPSVTLNEGENLVASAHTHPPMEGSMHYMDMGHDLTSAFPSYDKAVGNNMTHMVLDNKEIVIFSNGNFSYQPGTYLRYSTDYYFSSFGQRFSNVLFTW
jgi:RHS repeat-associated protein